MRQELRSRGNPLSWSSNNNPFNANNNNPFNANQQGDSNSSNINRRITKQRETMVSSFKMLDWEKSRINSEKNLSNGEKVDKKDVYMRVYKMLKSYRKTGFSL